MKQSRIFHNLQRNVEEESTYTFFNYRPRLQMKFLTSKVCTVVKKREGAIRVAICVNFPSENVSIRRAQQGGSLKSNDGIFALISITNFLHCRTLKVRFHVSIVATFKQGQIYLSVTI